MKHQKNLSFFYKFNLTSTNFNFFFAFRCLFHYAHTPLVISRFLAIEQQVVAAMRLCHISDLETCYAMATEPIDRPQVDDVLNIFYAIDVAINVDIAVTGLHRAHIFGIG